MILNAIDVDNKTMSVSLKNDFN